MIVLYSLQVVSQAESEEFRQDFQSSEASMSVPKIIPSAKQHPTPKPPELAEHFIGLHTKQGQLVVDPFAGGGSTMVACARLGRRCIGIELSEEFCDITVANLRAELSQPRLPFPETITEHQSDLFGGEGM